MNRPLWIPVLGTSLLILAVQGPLQAVPFAHSEYGAVPIRESSPADDACRVAYYNYCGGWVWYWTGYCGLEFEYCPRDPRLGTCFDLSGCPTGCRHLTDVWWACKHLTLRGGVDVEIYCASFERCPIGPPLAGIYGFAPSGNVWQHMHFDNLELCPCEEAGSGKFIVMLTLIRGLVYGAGFTCYSDMNDVNIAAGCESEWRCTGHSFFYRNHADYCAAYGEPCPLWIDGPTFGCTNAPAIPAVCYGRDYETGYYSEFLIDCYISCQGPTATHEESWSNVKDLYR